MIPILKYPRTPHVAGSRLQPGDEDVAVIACEALEACSLVVEEKLDGSNSGISFDRDGSLILQSRGHVLTGGPRERQFDLLKRWANHHVAALGDILGERYVMYGEWLYARHTIAYDQLPHEFLGTELRTSLLCRGPVLSVPVLGTGSIRRIDSYIGRSRFSSTETMEGLYLKQEEEGRVVGRYKYVRPGFLQAVAASDSHWMDRLIEPNTLCEGVDIFA